MDVFEREMDIPVKWIGNPNFEIMLSMHFAKNGYLNLKLSILLLLLLA